MRKFRANVERKLLENTKKLKKPKFWQIYLNENSPESPQTSENFPSLITMENSSSPTKALI